MTRRRRRRHVVVRRRSLGDDTAIASVMWVNNEIGTIQPIDAARAPREERRRAVSHRRRSGVRQDRRSTRTAVPFDVLTISGHKIGAPKGIGAMFIRRGMVDRAAVPRRHAGPRASPGHGERRRRHRPRARRRAGGRRARGGVAASRARCATGSRTAILARVPDAVIHGRGAPQRAPHIANVSVPGTDSESMLMALDLRGIGCSAGSACQSGSVSPSHVLSAIGVSTDLASARDSHEPWRPDDRSGHRSGRRGFPGARRQGARRARRPPRTDDDARARAGRDVRRRRFVGRRGAARRAGLRRRRRDDEAVLPRRRSPRPPMLLARLGERRAARLSRRSAFRTTC